MRAKRPQSHQNSEQRLGFLRSALCRVSGAHGDQRRGTMMRTKLLASTAALLATIAFASAQNMPGGQGGSQPGGAMQKQESPSGATSQRRGGEAGQSKGDRTQ